MPIHKDFNKNFFKKWSNDMAYILGFLFADGNMVKTKRNTHFVAFYTADFRNEKINEIKPQDFRSEERKKLSLCFTDWK